MTSMQPDSTPSASASGGIAGWPVANHAITAKGMAATVPASIARPPVSSGSPDVLSITFHAACMTAASATSARTIGGNGSSSGAPSRRGGW